MNRVLIRRFFAEWFEASKDGFVRGTFGWIAFLGATLICYFWYHSRSNQITLPDWFPPIEGGAFGILFAVLFNVFVNAPFRAYRMLNPLSVSLISGMIDEAHPASDQFDLHKAAMVIKNRSYKSWADCVLHILSVDDLDSKNFPRYVGTFSLSSGDKKVIPFATWTSRESPYKDDDFVRLSGPISPGYGGNLINVPCGTNFFALRIGLRNASPIVIKCKVCVYRRAIEVKAIR